MSTVTHATFCIERILNASPARVWNAFADQGAKDQWFTGAPDWERTERSFDFRVGGRETSSVGPKGGVQHVFDALYQDIVPGQRIIFTYTMYLDQARMSVSNTTIEFEPAGAGTRLRFTEQGVFLLDPADAPNREAGTQFLMDKVAASLADETARA